MGTGHKLPGAMVHVKTFRGPLRWIDAFLREQHGPLRRTLTLGPRPTGRQLVIVAGTSPWGMCAAPHHVVVHIVYWAETI